jgi:hypothetical protein
MRLQARTWAKVTVGLLLIGGVLIALWAEYRPSVKTVRVTATPTPQPLRDTQALIVLSGPRRGRAQVSCDGARRRATGFWRRDPAGACEALRSTRGALLAGPGCRKAAGIALHVSGAYGSKRFDHRAQRAGCPDQDAWLAVNVLGSPVLKPDRELEKPGQ